MKRTVLFLAVCAGLLALIPFGSGCDNSNAISTPPGLPPGAYCNKDGCFIPGPDGKIIPMPKPRVSSPSTADSAKPSVEPVKQTSDVAGGN